jgi:hypothetical protein
MRKNRRNAFYLIAALALLGLGACSNENNENGNGYIIPGREGMVTFRVPVSVDEGAGTKTRSAGNEPIHFSNDLGNGFVMESTLTVNETPKTRASQLLKSTYFLMIAFDGSSSPVGCERLQTAADGTLTFELPKETNYRLVFYSLNDGSDGSSFDPTQYISGGGVTNDYEEGTYQALSSGASLKSGVSIPLYTESDTHHDYCPHDVICASTKINTAQVPSSVALHFKHLFAQINWKVVSSTDDNPAQNDDRNPSGQIPGIYDCENITAVTAGFTPRYQQAQLTNLSLMPSTDGGAAVDADNLQKLWEPKTSTVAGPTADDHWNSTYTIKPNPGSQPSGDDAGGLSGTTFSSIVIPTSDKNVRIHIKSLTFHYIQIRANGDRTVADRTITDYDIPILDSDKKPVSFQPGSSYTVTSYLTAIKPFAYSNIFWDGKGLNFYTDDANTLAIPNQEYPKGDDDPAYYQGVLFPWASMIAFSPRYTGDGMFLNKFNVYAPDGKGGYTDGQTRTLVAQQYQYHTDGLDFNTVPLPYTYLSASDQGSNKNYATVTWANQNYMSTPDENGNSFGDPCAYLTHGTWRLPDVYDFARAHLSILDSHGYYAAPPYIDPNEDWAKTLKLKGDGTTIIPDTYGAAKTGIAAGSRIFPSAGQGRGGSYTTEYVGQAGYYWTSGFYRAISDNAVKGGAQNGYIMEFPSGKYSLYVEPSQGNSMSYLLPIRCVKNSGLSIDGFIDDGESTGTLTKQ